MLRALTDPACSEANEYETEKEREAAEQLRLRPLRVGAIRHDAGAGAATLLSKVACPAVHGMDSAPTRAMLSSPCTGEFSSGPPHFSCLGADKSTMTVAPRVRAVADGLAASGLMKLRRRSVGNAGSPRQR